MKIKKDIGRSQKDDEYECDNDPENYVPNFEEYSTFLIGHRDEHVSRPRLSSLNMACKGFSTHP